MRPFHWFVGKLWKTHAIGQGMVEFALALPIVLLLMLGIIEAGRLLFMYSSVVSASREGARYGAAMNNFNDCGGIKDAAKSIGSFAGVSDANISIKYDRPIQGATNTPVPYSTSCPPGDAKLGDRIWVSVSADYQPIIPVPGFHGLTIESQNVHTIVINVPVYAPTPTPTTTPST